MGIETLSATSINIIFVLLHIKKGKGIPVTGRGGP
jgi:hypothetical protein